MSNNEAPKHSPIEGTINFIYHGDAREATCANCNKVIVEWNYRDNDGDRVKHIYSPWAVEVLVPISSNSSKVVKDTICKAV